MKKTLVILSTAAALVGWVSTQSVTSSSAAQAQSHSVSANSAPRVPQVRWAEDSLPPELYLWVQVNDGELVGPRRADRWARAATGSTHRGCYAATGDTMLIMCPDGTVAYS